MEILERFRRHHRGMAVGLGSSDGYRLQPYADAGWRTLGVEPAGARTALAQLSGLHAIPMPFTPDLARRLIRSGLRADVVLTGDLLARAEAPGSVLDALRGMLASGGRVVLRVPIVDERLVTVVDPEYRSYFSPTAVLCLLSRHGYSVESQRIAIGAVGLEARLVVRTASSPSPGFAPLSPAAVEDLWSLQNRERVIYPLRQAIRSAHSEGRRIATLGAGRATSNLLNLVGAQPSDVTFATDVNPAKIGLRLPGSNVPIASVNALFQPPAPEVVVIADPRVSRDSRRVQKDLRDHGRLVLDLCDPQPAPEPVSRLAAT